MKKITIAWLLVAGCSYLISSCHKPDIPCKKFCQIKSIEDIYKPNPFTTTGSLTNYAYTHKRLLDSLTIKPLFTAETPFHARIQYNNQGRPLGSTDNLNRTYKFIYQNGRVVRIDLLGADNLFHPKYTFVYDSQGRIIERQDSDGSALRWEYAGTSTNFIRKLNMQVLRPGGGLEIFMKHEYQYDNKVNPMTTWPNTTLVPFYFEVVENSSHQYEPIPKNNWVHQNVTSNFRGAQVLFREYHYTYQYDDVYPVKYDLLLLTHNPFIGSVDTTSGTTRFTYNCVGDNANF
jgi:YD repeat-containing protein